LGLHECLGMVHLLKEETHENFLNEIANSFVLANFSVYIHIYVYQQRLYICIYCQKLHMISFCTVDSVLFCIRSACIWMTTWVQMEKGHKVLGRELNIWTSYIVYLLDECCCSSGSFNDQRIQSCQKCGDLQQHVSLSHIFLLTFTSGIRYVHMLLSKSRCDQQGKNEHYMESLISGNVDTKINSKKAHENGYNSISKASLKHKTDSH
jgi:hypothetical protein